VAAVHLEKVVLVLFPVLEEEQVDTARKFLM
jgi:hypothetical protein